MLVIAAAVEAVWQQTLQIAGRDYDLQVAVSSETPVRLFVTREALEPLNDSYLVRIRLESAANTPFTVDDFAIHWRVPAVDMHGMYFGGDPRGELGYLPFHAQTKDVAAHIGLPFMALMHRSGENRAAYGLLDQLTETRLASELSEITRCFHLTLRKPANGGSLQQRIPVQDGVWEEVFFVSHARAPWPEVLAAYARTAAANRPQPAMPVPEHAYDPVFCSWTAIHHDVSHEWIMRNAPIAADLGFRTWLTDDGWFIEKGEFGKYPDVGAWLPDASKFPDFKAHVAQVQALGFRYVLWVAPFMIGEHSQQERDYADLLTTGQEREQFRNLSPWHDATTAIVRDLLRRLMEDYGLDGLKIDFIDAVNVHSRKLPGASEAPLGWRVYEILQAAIDGIRPSKPDLLIEFRNQYANLASRRYANIYRSSDVPINFTLNRWQTVLLRLLAPDRAVHMDPMLWHPDDSDENVAAHLINGIASVPMVSLELDQYPASHLAIIRHWIGFYDQHRQTIIHGAFKPHLKPTHIPMIDFVGEDEVITGLYDDVALTQCPSAPVWWILNASTRPYIEIAGTISGSYTVIARNRFGQTISESRCDPLPVRLDVEVGGSLEIRSDP